MTMPKKQSINYSETPLNTMKFALFILLILVYSFLFAACVSLSPEPSPYPTSTSIPSATAIPPSVTPSPTATLISPDPPYLTWIDPDLPRHLIKEVAQSEYLAVAENESEAQLMISISEDQQAGFWLYLAVAPFYSYADNVLAADLFACWTSNWESPLPFNHIYVSEDTRETFEVLWGPASEECVGTASQSEIPHLLWIENDAVALIPFDLAEPAYKVLKVDDQDPLSGNFQPAEYPLSIGLAFQVPAGYQIDLNEIPYQSNYDPAKLTSIALTGVTALVRDTANIMENEGVTYPAGDIQDILVGASITHISNEVPFASDCPTPDASQVSLQFCSDDRYIELLEVVGTDIVELSGDHFGDWGPEAMLHTLDLYAQKGWLVYGGGETLSDGLAPVFLTHNDNHFAFIGCNGKGIDKYATATDDNPGAAKCDFKWMIPEITRLANEGYIVIATMQHEEVDSFGSIALQRYDFRSLAEAGAVIVSGSQSHHPQAIEFTGSSFIHYGLGNLFFDQWYLAHYNPKSHINKDKAFIDQHYFYDGKYIGTRLIPLQFIDNARPRPMTDEEKIPFLDEFYKYSLWNGEWIYLYSTGYMSDRMNQ